MKNFTPAVLAAVAVLGAQAGRAQVSIGSSGATLKAGTTLFAQGLVLTPSADFSLANDTITLSTTPLSGTSGSSINRLYSFQQPRVFSGNIGIRYTAADLNGNTESNLQIVVGNAGSYTTGTSSTTASAGSYLVSQQVSGVTLQRLTAVNTGVALPVGLSRFTASRVGNGALLSWDASAERGILEYVVERSADGRQFSALGRVPATGRPSYSFPDARLDAGANYYRLRIVEVDGTAILSRTAVLYGDGGMSSVSIAPNPATDRLVVNVPAGQEGTLTVVNTAGALVLRQAARAGENVLPLSSLQAGVYLLQIGSPRGRQTFNFVKQ